MRRAPSSEPLPGLDAPAAPRPPPDGPTMLAAFHAVAPEVGRDGPPAAPPVEPRGARIHRRRERTLARNEAQRAGARARGGTPPPPGPAPKMSTIRRQILRECGVTPAAIDGRGRLKPTATPAEPPGTVARRHRDRARVPPDLSPREARVRALFPGHLSAMMDPAWRMPKRLERFALMQGPPDGPGGAPRYWLSTHETPDDAAAYVSIDDSGLRPTVMYDLDTGDEYEPIVAAHFRMVPS